MSRWEVIALRLRKTLAVRIAGPATGLLLLLLPAVCIAQAEESADPAAFKGWVASSLEIAGLEKGLAEDLAKGLALSGQKKFLRTRRPVFYPETLGEDIRRSRLFMARHGYPYAQVAPAFEPSPEQRRVRVILNVRPGPPVLVVSAQVEGIPPPLAGHIPSASRIPPGSRFSEAEFEATTRALDTLGDDGFILSPVDNIRSTSEDVWQRVLFFIETWKDLVNDG